MEHHLKKTSSQGTKRTFLKLGTCSRTFFYLLNREFGHPTETEERAADPLAGGLMQTGHQCGMLWGASMAVGAESYRRNNDHGQAIITAIKATQHLMESFSKRAKSVNCRDVTHCDWSSKVSMAKYFFSGKFLYCFKLAEKWAPEAIQSATKELSRKNPHLTQTPISCASEIAKKMGAGNKEMVIVAGFAGGLGLSGNACGALSAAIWMKSLDWCRENPGKSSFFNPEAKNTLKAFHNATGGEILCNKICRQTFRTIDDHAEFIKNGGCDKLMNVLAQ